MSNNERDELADLIWDLAIRHLGVATSSSKSMADELLAAGYRKPRTIKTVEELDALPDGSIILDARRLCREGLRTMGSGNVWRAMGPAQVLRSKEIALPATVLHEPKATL